MEFQNLTEVLNFAVTKEQFSYDAYKTFSELVKNEAAKKLLEDLARQELGHKRMLKDALLKKDIYAVVK